ncbi:hemerythrin domain-containing protein [Streptomyces sp. NBC_01136]|nr:hemerythrin domain-containing protein [Streptomyces sp. NBC_01136]
MFDGREMSMLHDMFRREFALMPGLVRAVAQGDHERVAVVSSHIGNVSTDLHHHHVGEDMFVWPLLLERCADECGPLVNLMENQHEAVAALVDEVAESLAAWRGSFAFGDQEALAGALDRLIPVLKEHLHAEEEHVVPLMEKHIPAAEWDEIVQKGAVNADPDTMPLTFGMLMYEADAEVVENAIAKMPPEVQPIIRRIAPQAYATHAQLIHGTPTPPRSTEM